MPAKNVVKQYLFNGYYHIYNRGVEKRIIFQNDQDYKVFLSYLKEYLEPQNKILLRKKLAEVHWTEKDKILKKLTMNNFSDEISLLAFCLMPNHFHLLVKQKSERGIEKFMKSLSTRYVIYFNTRHKRVGGLFQSTYKAVLVESDEQLLHLSRYIHSNPASQGLSLLEHSYSSLSAYLSKWRAYWLKPKEILDFFSKNYRDNDVSSYKQFIFSENLNSESNRVISCLQID